MQKPDTGRAREYRNSSLTEQSGRKRKEIETELRNSGSNIEIETTEQHKGIEIIPRIYTEFGEIPTEAL